jgi:hypothetical protein
MEKFSQGRSNVADDAQPGRPVEITTEATVQRVFRKVCAQWVPRELKDRENKNRMGLSLQHLLRYADEEDMLNRIDDDDDDDECGAVGGKKIGMDNRSTRRKPAPVPLCPP